MTDPTDPSDDGPIPGLSSLRETTPPPSLVPAVMRRIADPGPVSFWSWLRKPRRSQLRLSQLGALASAPAPTHPSDDGPIPGLSSLRETTPPPSLVPAVMRRIADPGPVTFWSWLRKPRRFELRLSPLGALASAAAGLSLLVVLVVGRSGRERDRFIVEVPATSDSAGMVVVRLTLVAQGARQVAVAGDFNNWDPNGTQLVNQDGSGTFAGTVRLPPGAHEYMFVVDGKWVTDPTAAELRPDGFGRTNAVLRL